MYIYTSRCIICVCIRLATGSHCEYDASLVGAATADLRRRYLFIFACAVWRLLLSLDRRVHRCYYVLLADITCYCFHMSYAQQKMQSFACARISHLYWRQRWLFGGNVAIAPEHAYTLSSSPEWLYQHASRIFSAFFFIDLTMPMCSERSRQM